METLFEGFGFGREVIPLTLGLFLPLVLSILLRRSWAHEVKFLLMLLASLVLGAISSYLAGELQHDPGYILVDTAQVALVAQVVYHLAWRRIEQRLAMTRKVTKQVDVI